MDYLIPAVLAALLGISGWILIEVIKTNGSVKGLLVWKDEHTLRDDERFRAIKERALEMHTENKTTLAVILDAVRPPRRK